MLTIFFILCALEVVGLFAWHINEADAYATTSLVVFGLVSQWIFKVDVFGFLKTHTVLVVEMGLVYLALGLVWSLIKWFFFVRDKRELYLEMKSDHEKEYANLQTQLQGVDDLDKNVKFKLSRMKGDFDHSVSCKVGVLPPVAREYKNQIVSWISYWPISLTWTMLDDFLTKIFRQVYELFAGVFQRISNSQFKDINMGAK